MSKQGKRGVGETPQAPYEDDSQKMAAITAHLASKAAKIRALTKAGYSRSVIAAHLGIRYQHVRNVQTQVAPGTPDSKHMTTAILSRNDAYVHMVLDVDARGQVTLPAEIRAAIGLSGPGKLVAVTREGELRMITPERGLARARAIVAKYNPEGRLLSEELIRERREEFAREMLEDEETS